MLVLLLFGSFLALTARAQTGVICGTVTDAKFKEPLIGATVSIEGTTIGAITDIDGNFRIEKVQPGKYTLVASYVSYKTQTIKDVVVIAHQEAVVRIELSDADLQLQKRCGCGPTKTGDGDSRIEYRPQKPSRSERNIRPADQQDAGQRCCRGASPYTRYYDRRRPLHCCSWPGTTL